MNQCQYYLAVDIGASSGRHILGWMENGRLQLREVHRFLNGMENRNGTLCWDTSHLFREIKAGMKKCADLEIIPVSMGIDTWAVDYVLLDSDGEAMGNAVGYRDGRTRGMEERVEAILSPAELYKRTGIQRQPFNTIYQLMAEKDLEKAEGLLMIPDYFHYLLTGVQCQEYTNATTTQLVNPHTGDWDRDLIGRLGYPIKLFGPLSMPGTVVGELTETIRKEVGFSCQVVLPPTHDTASAVLAAPSDRDSFLYISSGTWSLMGTERAEADCREESRKANFTSEGGYDHRFRYLKNIMGLWMIQSVKKEWELEGMTYSFGEICEGASHESIASLVDCNDDSFLAPPSMAEAVGDYCKKTGQRIPKTRWELAAVIYNSLAMCYKECAGQLEILTGRHFEGIHIVGGGSNADYLNRLTARATQKTVYAGPPEATAVGNLMAQMLERGEWGDVKTARSCIFHSFDIKIYRPQDAGESRRPL